MDGPGSDFTFRIIVLQLCYKTQILLRQHFLLPVLQIQAADQERTRKTKHFYCEVFVRCDTLRECNFIKQKNPASLDFTGFSRFAEAGFEPTTFGL